MFPFFDSPLANLKLMIMPAITLGTALAAITMRQTRSALLEVLQQEYITTARAKGLAALGGDQPPRTQERVHSGRHHYRIANGTARWRDGYR